MGIIMGTATTLQYPGAGSFLLWIFGKVWAITCSTVVFEEVHEPSLASEMEYDMYRTSIHPIIEKREALVIMTESVETALFPLKRARGILKLDSVQMGHMLVKPSTLFHP